MRIRTWVVAVAVVFGGLVALAPGVASATPVATCRATSFAATTSVATRPGGTTVTVTLTENSALGCRVNPAMSVQWLRASGASLPSAVASPSSSPSAVLGLHQQARFTLSTMEGVQCTQRPSNAIELIATTRLRVMLPTSVGVCVGGTTAWSTQSAVRMLSAPSCTNAQVRVGVGPGNGAAGTFWFPITFRNVSSAACVVSGTPNVWALNRLPAGNLAVLYEGRPARHEPLYGVAIRLLPGETASAAYGVGDTGNWSSTTCAPVKAAAISVQLGRVSADVALASTVCTKLASTVIEGVVPGANGTA